MVTRAPIEVPLLGSNVETCWKIARARNDSQDGRRAYLLTDPLSPLDSHFIGARGEMALSHAFREFDWTARDHVGTGDGGIDGYLDGWSIDVKGRNWPPRDCALCISDGQPLRAEVVVLAAAPLRTPNLVWLMGWLTRDEWLACRRRRPDRDPTGKRWWANPDELNSIRSLEFLSRYAKSRGG